MDTSGIFISVKIIVVFTNIPRWAHMYILKVWVLQILNSPYNNPSWFLLESSYSTNVITTPERTFVLK